MPQRYLPYTLAPSVQHLPLPLEEHTVALCIPDDASKEMRLLSLQMRYKGVKTLMIGSPIRCHSRRLAMKGPVQTACFLARQVTDETIDKFLTNRGTGQDKALSLVSCTKILESDTTCRHLSPPELLRQG